MTKSLPRRRSNPTLEIIFKDYPKYSAWGFLALEWFKTLRLITNLHIRGVAYFIIDYLVTHKISGDPSVFLSIDFNAPNSVTLGFPDTPTGRNVSNQLCAFLDFVLTKTHNIGGIVHNYTNPNCFRNPVSRRVITSGKSKFKYTVMPGLTTKSNDIQFIWLQEVADERIIQWRRYAISYMKFQKRSVAAKLNALSKFFQYYLINMNIFVNPEEFLLRSNTFPDFYNHCCLNLKSGKKITMIVNDFINHVLIEGFSVPDDYNRPVIPYDYHNPIAIPDVKYYEQPFESVRSTLAYGYIEEIRSMIAEGPNFSDWKFAHSATGRRDFVNCPDWFVVDKKLIDENDPDCVWRHRRPIGRVEEIYEMWSPVSWVALLLKTILPLRSMQIRMLDSGEADTFRYENGEWHLNTGKLASGRPGKSHNNGVLRRKVAEDGSVITMLFANTNKTADAEKTGDKKGFEFPWVKFTGVEGDPFYWIEKLRNWQQKYNPISRPANWDEMDGRRIQAKSKYQISMYSPTCFLFRMPEERPGSRHLPLKDTSLDQIWYKTLLAYESRLEKRKEKAPDGSKVRFLPESPSHKNSIRTLYPLHCLRVSLISSLAQDGKVPIEVLMKVVGHSRLLMTIYYNKMGESYKRQVLDEAVKRMEANGGASIVAFLRNASFEQLKAKLIGVGLDTLGMAIPTSPGDRNAAGWEAMPDGICLMGGNTSPIESEGHSRIGGCYNGGPKIDRGFGPVPGGTRNCIRCRWFVTLHFYAFALVARFNNISYDEYETRKELRRLDADLTVVRNDRYDAEKADIPFERMEELKNLARVREQVASRWDHELGNLIACLDLVNRCFTAMEAEEAFGDPTKVAKMQLVTPGTIRDIRMALDEVDSERLHLATACQDLEIYADLEPTKKIVRYGQLLDAVLMNEGYQPVFLHMTEREQLLNANAFTRELARRADATDELKGRARVISLMDANENLGEHLGLALDSLESLSLKPFGQKPAKSVTINTGKSNVLHHKYSS